MRVDHENTDEVEALFERIAKEQDGRLDILVNNAYKGVEVRAEENEAENRLIRIVFL